MNAFSLWGELRVDTKQFERAMHDSEVELNKVERSMGDVEKKARSLGQTSATAARQHEKLTDAVKQQRQRLLDAAAAFEKGDISGRKFAAVVNQTETRVNALNSRLKDHAARLADLPGRWSKVSSTLRQAASEFTSVAGWVGAASAAVGTFSIRAANNLENARNKFTALEGSVGKANERIQKLLDLSRRSPGVNFDEALQSFGQLKVLGSIGDSSINKMIQALGRLRLAFDSSMGSSSDFLLNMQQLFDQGFEAQDWKQAIGRVQIFAQLVKKAFGTDDPAKLKELKESGKLTIESWISGFAEAADNDSRLSSLKETWSTKLSKAFTEVNFAAAPLGDKILAAIQPEFDRAMEGLKSGNYAEVGNAIGVTLGKAIGTGLKGTLTADSALGEGSVGTSIGEGILSGFDAVDSSTVVKTFFNKIGLEISTGIVDLVALIESGSLIGGPLKLADYLLEKLGFTVNESTSHQRQLESYFRGLRENIQAQFEKNTIEILQQSKASFDKIANDSSATESARNAAKKHSEAIAGEIEQAQQRLNAAVAASTVEASKRLGASILATEPAVSNAMQQVITSASTKATVAATNAGTNIGQGFANGIRSQLGIVKKAISDLTEIGIIQPPHKLLESQSPSRVFFRLGKDVAQGFIDGIEDMRLRVSSAIVSLFDVSKLKGLGKKDIAGTEFATQLMGDIKSLLDDLNPMTATQAALLELQKQKYAGLNEEVKKYVVLLAQQKDFLTAIKNFSGDTESPDIGTGRPDVTSDGMWHGLGKGEVFGDLFKDVPNMLAKQLPPPPSVIASWEDFWTRMNQELVKFTDSLPTVKEALGTNLIDTINDISNVFADAAIRWDGTLKGFFASVGQGFADLARQIIGNLIRIAIQALITKLITSLIGGFGGGGSAGTLPGGGDAGAFSQVAGLGRGNGVFGLASGGSVRGPGTSTSDSILARLSNSEFVQPAKAVKKYGSAMMESIRSLSFPTAAFAGGGWMSESRFQPGYSQPTTRPSQSSADSRPIIVNNHFHANQNGSFSKESADQASRKMVGQLRRSSDRGNDV
jgi:hypothetical protein